MATGPASNPALIASFERELALNCLITGNAWETLRRLRRKRQFSGVTPGSPVRPPAQKEIVALSTDTYAAVHVFFLGVAANSRILWPFEGKPPRKPIDLVRQQLADDLLSKLHLPPTPLLRSRRVRNALEHTEKAGVRWVRWATKSFPGQPLGGWFFGDGVKPNPGDPPMDRIYRFLDNKAWDLKVGKNVACNLKEVMVEVQILSDRLRYVRQVWSVAVPKTP